LPIKSTHWITHDFDNTLKNSCKIFKKMAYRESLFPRNANLLWRLNLFLFRWYFSEVGQNYFYIYNLKWLSVKPTLRFDTNVNLTIYFDYQEFILRSKVTPKYLSDCINKLLSNNFKIKSHQSLNETL